MAEDKWIYGGSMQKQEPQEESWGANIGRHAARTAKTVAREVVAFPGNMMNTGQDWKENAEKEENVSPSRQLHNQVLSGLLPSSGPLGFLSKVLPTSKTIEEKVVKPLTGEKLQPQGSGEQFWDDIVSDVTNSVLPGGKFTKSKVLAPVAGNLASWVTGELGGSEEAKTGAKIITNVLAGFPGSRRALDKKMKSNYKAADAMVTPKTAVPAAGLKSNLKKITKEIDFGKDTAGKQLARSTIKEIENKIKNGKAPILEFRDMKRGINKEIGDLTKNNKDANYWLSKINRSIKDEVFKPYGEINPEWMQHFNVAEDISRGMLESSKLGKFLMGNASLKSLLQKEGVVKNLLLGAGVIGTGYVTGPATAAKLLGAGLGVREFVKNIDLLRNSKEARKYYMNILKASEAGNVNIARSNIIKLNKVAEKLMPEKVENPDWVYGGSAQQSI